MDKIKIIEVGFGACGRTWYSNVISNFPNVEVVGCVEINPEIRAKLMMEYGHDDGMWPASLKEALATREADAVLIAAYIEGHYPLAKEALDAGKHVLVEKPFTRRIDEARELVDLAASKNLRLMVSQNYRFYPAPLTVRKIIREKQLGPVSSISIDFRHNHGFNQTADAKHALLEHPLLLDMAIHHFDLLRMILGRNPENVVCHTFNPPWSKYKDPPAAAAIMNFPDNITVSYRGNWMSHNTLTPWSGLWEVECEKGTIMWQSRKSAEDTSADSVFVRRYNGPDEEVPMVELPYNDRSGALNAFLQSIEKGEDGECSGQDNIGTLKFMNAMIESAEKGGFVGVVGKAKRNER